MHQDDAASATGADLEADRYPEPRDLWKEHAPGPALDTAAALPACLAEIVEPVAEARGHDVGALALSVACALSACLRQRSRIAAHPTLTTWQEGSAVWGALIGESGNGKSPSMQFAVAPLSAIEGANLADYMRAKEAAGEGETPPAAERLLMSNSTIEALGVQYANTAHRLLNYRDEGTAFINGMGRYNGKSDAERGDWCSAWNCAPHSVDRISRESLRHDDWGVSLLMGLTPSQMKEAADEARQDGLPARMLQCVVRPSRGRSNPRARRRLPRGLWRAGAGRVRARHCHRCTDPSRGRRVRYGAGAFRRSGRRIRRQQSPDGRMAAQGGRQYAARGAGIHRCRRRAWPHRPSSIDRPFAHRRRSDGRACCALRQLVRLPCACILGTQHRFPGR